MVIFSGELVLGPVNIKVRLPHCQEISSSQSLTNRANDAAPTVILLGLVIDVEIALPFQLGAVGEMVESVTHLV